MITCQIMSTTRKKYLFCTLFIYILSTAQYINEKKNPWPTLVWTAHFLRKVFFPQNWFELFILYINTRIIPLMLLKRVNLVSFAWYYPNKQKSKFSSEFDLTNSMTTSVIWVHSQYFKIKHFMINVLFTVWLLMNTSTKVASA